MPYWPALGNVDRKLREAEAELNGGSQIGQVCQKLAISEQTFHRWRNQYGGMKSSAAKRLKELEEENRRLKRAVADLTLDKQILTEASEFLEKWLTPSRRRAAVAYVQRSLSVSQRRACVVLNQARRTQRYVPKRRDDEGELVKSMLELVRIHPRYGYRRVWAVVAETRMCASTASECIGCGSGTV